MKHIAFWSRRIKLAVHVDVNGDIENIGIIVESTLTSVSWRYLASQIASINGELYTVMDIPTRKDFR
jgi:hypothetical protein